MDRPLRAVPAEYYDEVVRLAAFRRAHPEVVVRRYELRDLLDELGRLLGVSRPGDPG